VLLNHKSKGKAPEQYESKIDFWSRLPPPTNRDNRVDVEIS